MLPSVAWARARARCSRLRAATAVSPSAWACLGGRQTLPGDKQEHLALSLGQLGQRHLKLLPARAGIKALVDSVPVDGSDLVLRDLSQ
jgi:hypothetical protein